ncbi:hypothetical protein [Maioricimonas rarisocia]|nr:hypothetical protein [Maioricimonas rarisocia]
MPLNVAECPHCGAVQRAFGLTGGSPGTHMAQTGRAPDVPEVEDTPAQVVASFFVEFLLPMLGMSLVGGLIGAYAGGMEGMWMGMLLGLPVGLMLMFFV